MATEEGEHTGEKVSDKDHKYKINIYCHCPNPGKYNKGMSSKDKFHFYNSVLIVWDAANRGEGFFFF